MGSNCQLSEITDAFCGLQALFLHLDLTVF